MAKVYDVFCLEFNGDKFYAVFRYGEKCSNGSRERIFYTPFLNAPKAIQSVCDYYNSLYDLAVSICNVSRNFNI